MRLSDEFCNSNSREVECASMYISHLNLYLMDILEKHWLLYDYLRERDREIEKERKRGRGNNNTSIRDEGSTYHFGREYLQKSLFLFYLPHHLLSREAELGSPLLRYILLLRPWKFISFWKCQSIWIFLCFRACIIFFFLTKERSR